jgi:hypothetical protein
MTNYVQTTSFEVVNSQETLTQTKVSETIKSSSSNPSFDRDELKNQLEFHICSLHGKALEEDLDGFVNIRFFGGSSYTDDKFYKLSDIYSRLDEITDFLIKNNKLSNHHATILPVLTKYEVGRNENDNLHSVASVIFDIDKGNIAEILSNISSILGKPSFIVASGGLTDDNQKKLHIYYKLQSTITGNKEVLDFFKLKKQFAELVDTDVDFEKPTQPVRLLGSTNYKYGVNTTIIESNKNIYDSQSLLAKMRDYVENNSQKLLLNSTPTDKEDSLEILDFHSNQPPLENLTLGEMYDYLIQLGQAPFEKYRNNSSDPKWLDIIFALNHQTKGSEDGYDLALRWSLTDKTGRSEENIRDGVKKAYYAAKSENSNKKLLTFRSIINFINNKDFVAKELSKNTNLGSLVSVFDSTEMFGDTFVLTDKYLLVKVTKGSGKNQVSYLKNISDYIDVLGTGYSDSNKVYSLVKVKDRKGCDVLKTIPIGVKPADLRLFLINKLNYKFEDITGSFTLLQKYLMAREEKNTQINIVNKLGWGCDNNVYLLPYKKDKKDDIKVYSVDKTNKDNSNYYLESTTKPEDCLAIKRSLQEWQENIAKYARGNDLMSFCLFIPFASSWYTPLAEQPLIFHIYGESRKGKTILLNLASSVLGFSGHLGYSNWNSTLVALENLAAIKNDNLLILDELHSCTSDRVLTEAPYLFVNSRGKSRGAKNQEDDTNIVTRTWQVQVLSSGENSFEAELVKRNQLVRGGHRNRVIDLQAVVGDFGVFNTIHDFDKKFDGQAKAKEKGLKAFVDHLEKAALKYKGTAIEGYFNYIFNTKTHSDILVDVRNLKLEWENQYLFSLKSISSKNMGDIASRANNFATIAAAAVIACDAGVLPFDKKYVFEVVGKIFNKYINSIKDVYLTADDRAIKDLLVKFLNNNLHNGFFDKSNPSNNSIYTKYYGFKRAANYCRQTGTYFNYRYFLNVNIYEEIFKGYSRNTIRRFLQEQGYILSNPDRKPSVDYTFKIKDKDNNAINCNLLDLVAIGVVFPDSSESDDKEPVIKGIGLEVPNEVDLLPDVNSTDLSETAKAEIKSVEASNNSSLVNSTATTTAASNWPIYRDRDDLLAYLLAHNGVPLKFSFKATEEDICKPDQVQELYFKGQFDTEVQIFKLTNGYLSKKEKLAWRNVLLTWTDSHYPPTKENFYNPFCYYDNGFLEFEYWFPFLKDHIQACIKNLHNPQGYDRRYRNDLESTLRELQGKSVQFSYLLTGEDKNIKVSTLFFKCENKKTIVVSMGDSVFTANEQFLFNNVELVFSKAVIENKTYFPFLNFDYTHSLTHALLTENPTTIKVNDVSEPLFLTKSIFEKDLIPEIVASLIKNEKVYQSIEPEIFNEFNYRNSINDVYIDRW